MAPRVKVSPREDGADITIDGYIIEITVKPIEVLPQEPEPPTHPTQLTGAAAEEPLEAPPGEPEAQAHPDAIIEGLKLDLNPYIDDLNITEEQDYIVVAPRGYLGRKKFNSISSIIKQMGGHYVSADKMSRFLVPKRQTKDQV